MRRGKRETASRAYWPMILLAAAVIAAAAALLTPKLLERPPAPEEAPPVVQPAASEPEPAPGPLSGPVPEPEPIPEPEPKPEPDLASELLAGMSLHEKICQLFIVYPSAITGQHPVTEAGPATQAGLEKYPVGGLLYDKTNVVSQEQVLAMLTETQGYSKIPLIFTLDEEGGRVRRLMGNIGTTELGPMLSYRDEGPEKARENARTIAADILSCGFNMDLAPVADVWSNPDNTVIGDRAYSDSFQQASELVAAAVEGFHAGGAACTLKHFPGHGDTSADSHYGSVYVYKSLEELRAAELLPFQAGIDAGADAVMMGHMVIQAVDDQPALFSEKIVTELLREELGFEGVIMTDSLQMQAMTDHYGSGEIAVGAVLAGVDLLLCPMDLDAAVTALTEAVETGGLSEERIDQSVLRILRLKRNAGIIAEEGDAG